ncbi:MAG: acyl-CoA dehydrogenase [Desulfobacterales bacterium]|nr:acyl-CoA dehydrogenase [Desulfobacterales bacterium]
MAQLIADRRDIDFVLYEQLDVEQILKCKQYKDLNKKMFDMIITEARNFAIKELLPTYKPGDREGAKFDNGKVTVPECFHRAYKLFCEGEWIAMREIAEFGGQGLPDAIAQAALEYLAGANFPFALYPIAGHGTAKMIEIFGTPEQKETFAKKLYSGEWGGTMVLTEPQAGSDLGALSTSAVKNPDGTYSIVGNKIFISNAEHNLTSNIIHPVLARVEGAPKGTKGISIFIVPKYWVNEDGSLGELNDVVCTGIEEKMGIHGSCTCSLAFGSKGKCRGILLGEENIGMKVMFHMMNEARLAVGFQGVVFGSNAYLYALAYAKQRLQGKELERAKDEDAPQVPIIKHPDIRRMLLTMKSYVEGMRSFVYFVSLCFDKVKCAENTEDKEYYSGLIELFTPVIKAYCSDKGFDVCNIAMLIHGGYGYTKEFPIEQIVRDCKIASIYEGTNGIQAMDLLARKIGMKRGVVFMNFINEINKTINLANSFEGLKGLADKLDIASKRLQDTAMHIGLTAMSPNFKTAFLFAYPFLHATGDVIMAWMLLWRASVAYPKLEKIVGEKNQSDIIAKDNSAAFYDGQIKSAEFFINCLLPEAFGKMDGIKTNNDAALRIHDNSFGI